ncbi:methylenetetrahydrofolate reductase C-terminal domain-containing protein [Rhodospirillaceae bacterium SYSU D60014]|uniref:methylenetetrahydrofolate reductase C-terminal domain-containing protein n=1 Tax=Virgifigura deserti TaxID=2268457 RepID=UPI000E669B76
MYAVRLWSVRHSRLLESFYQGFERIIVRLDPLWKRIGYERLEQPVAAVERQVKGLLFDCQMCGQCALSSTGMSCPMNCPKNLRNGPCGGVRANGHCEVKPEMKCVWVKAWEGSQQMLEGKAILDVQKPVDNTLKGHSSWLRVAREKAGARAQPEGRAS